MYYLNSRYYDSNIGRFINADGLLGEQGIILGHNMFAYTQNNPVMYVDANGESLTGFLIYVLSTLLITGIASTMPENVSATLTGTPAGEGAEFEFFGLGIGYSNHYGISCNGYGECTDISGYSATLGILDYSVMTDSTGTTTNTISILIFKFSYVLDSDETMLSADIGVSFGLTCVSPTYGGASGSIDFDFNIYDSTDNE